MLCLFSYNCDTTNDHTGTAVNSDCSIDNETNNGNANQQGSFWHVTDSYQGFGNNDDPNDEDDYDGSDASRKSYVGHVYYVPQRYCAAFGDNHNEYDVGSGDEYNNDNGNKIHWINMSF